MNFEPWLTLFFGVLWIMIGAGWMTMAGVPSPPWRRWVTYAWAFGGACMVLWGGYRLVELIAK